MRKLIASGFMIALAICIGCAEPEAVTKKAESEKTPEIDKTPTAPPKAKPARKKPEHKLLGEEAPEIVGKDLDGVEFKLSDYRGKVVMLDFYGDW